MEGAIFLFLMISAAVALISGYAEDAEPTPDPSRGEWSEGSYSELTEKRLQVIGNRCKG